jgi:hypothetical protein
MPESRQPAAGGGGTPGYREVLRPAAWVWLLVAAFAAALGVAYGYAFDAATGWLVAALTLGLLAVLLGSLWRTRIEVTAAGFRADRALLPGRWIGRVAALDREQAFRARTDRADGRAHLVLRTWSTGLAVVVEVTDPDDPHPYWLVSSRRPVALAAAVEALRDRAAQAPDGPESARQDEGRP